MQFVSFKIDELAGGSLAGFLLGLFPLSASVCGRCSRYSDRTTRLRACGNSHTACGLSGADQVRGFRRLALDSKGIQLPPDGSLADLILARHFGHGLARGARRSPAAARHRATSGCRTSRPCRANSDSCLGGGRSIGDDGAADWRSGAALLRVWRFVRSFGPDSKSSFCYSRTERMVIGWPKAARYTARRDVSAAQMMRCAPGLVVLALERSP
jgi:hypothetical protein